MNYNSELPKEIAQIITLSKLYILNYPFDVFPRWIFNLKDLKKLMLKGNEIKVIPSEICELGRLKTLRIENSKGWRSGRP